jgi:hypothetical protein
MSDQFITEATTYTTRNKRKRQTSMPSVAFQSVIPAIKLAADLRLRPHTHRDCQLKLILLIIKYYNFSFFLSHLFLFLKISGTNRTQNEVGEKNHIMKHSMICTLHQLLLGWWNALISLMGWTKSVSLLPPSPYECYNWCNQMHVQLVFTRACIEPSWPTLTAVLSFKSDSSDLVCPHPNDCLL